MLPQGNNLREELPTQSHQPVSARALLALAWMAGRELLRRSQSTPFSCFY